MLKDSACAVALLAFSVALAAPPGAAAAGEIGLAFIPVDLHPEKPGVDRVGRLRYRGGLEVSSSDGRFGGFSGLSVDADGRGLIAVSDRGYWLTARLRHDRNGNLTGIDGGRMARLRDRAGKKLRKKGLSDAESLARVRQGFAVAFERRHRVAFHAAIDKPAVRERRAPEALSKRGQLPNNQGVEALAALPGGRLFALAEGPDGNHPSCPGWIVDGKSWRQLRYLRTVPFRPTGAARLPSGDILVLERRFSLIGGVGTRLAVIPVKSIKPGGTLTGREVGRLAPPLIAENFEGVAARRNSAGKTLVYLISDDNYNMLQRTLLLMFELTEPG